MDEILLNEYEFSKFSSTSRMLLKKRAQEKKYRKNFAVLLLNGGFGEGLARNMLNGGQLFPEEEDQADKIVGEEIRKVFENQPDFEAYEEPLTLENIEFIYAFISKEIPAALRPILSKIIRKRHQVEKDRFKQINNENSLKIETRKEEIKKFKEKMRFRYPLALLCLLVAFSGIIILFIGFDTWDYPRMSLGALLLSPVPFLTESRTGLIQFRKDVEANERIHRLRLEIGVLEDRVEKQRQKMNHLEGLLKKDEST